MRNLEKYKGIIPAFYACYDDNGAISPERVRALTEHLLKKGVKGVYVCGSSGECIYQSVAERKVVLENVMLNKDWTGWNKSASKEQKFLELFYRATDMLTLKKFNY